ncbi:MAG TPA: hypothetical protein VN376_00915 [Longilinea sp.]|nr:hypothetical protein [Longilinea sp.]
MTEEPGSQQPLIKHPWLMIVLPVYMLAALYDILADSPPFVTPSTASEITSLIFSLVLCLLPLILAGGYLTKQKKTAWLEWEKADHFVKGISLLLTAGFIKGVLLLGMLAFRSNLSTALFVYFPVTGLILILKWPGILFIAVCWWRLFRLKIVEFRSRQDRRFWAFLFDLLFTSFFALVILFLLYADISGFISMI